jgi:hypothetical protein
MECRREAKYSPGEGQHNNLKLQLAFRFSNSSWNVNPWRMHGIAIADAFDSNTFCRSRGGHQTR